MDNVYYGNIFQLDIAYLKDNILTFSEEFSNDNFLVFEGKYKNNTIFAYTLSNKEDLPIEYFNGTAISIYDGLFNTGRITLSDPPFNNLPKDFIFSSIFIYNDSKNSDTPDDLVKPLNLKYIFCIAGALENVNIPIDGTDYSVKKIEPSMVLPPSAIHIPINDIPTSINRIFPGNKECYYILSVIKPRELVDIWIDSDGKLTKEGEDELAKLCVANEVFLTYSILTEYGDFVMAANIMTDDEDVFDEDLYTIINISAMLDE